MRSIEWSREANLTFIDITKQIEEKWTSKEVENFIERTLQVIEFIRHNPNMYPFSKKGGIHRAVIAKQTSLYYHIVSTDKVVLLSFEDNRQNPSHLKY